MLRDMFSNGRRDVPGRKWRRRSSLSSTRRVTKAWTDKRIKKCIRDWCASGPQHVEIDMSKRTRANGTLEWNFWCTSCKKCSWFGWATYFPHKKLLKVRATPAEKHAGLDRCLGGTVADGFRRICHSGIFIVDRRMQCVMVPWGCCAIVVSYVHFDENNISSAFEWPVDTSEVRYWSWKCQPSFAEDFVLRRPWFDGCYEEVR